MDKSAVEPDQPQRPRIDPIQLVLTTLYLATDNTAKQARYKINNGPALSHQRIRNINRTLTDYCLLNKPL